MAAASIGTVEMTECFLCLAAIFYTTKTMLVTLCTVQMVSRVKLHRSLFKITNNFIAMQAMPALPPGESLIVKIDSLVSI